MFGHLSINWVRYLISRQWVALVFEFLIPRGIHFLIDSVNNFIIDVTNQIRLSLQPDALMFIGIESFGVERHLSDQLFALLARSLLFRILSFVFRPSLLALHIFYFTIESGFFANSLIAQIILQTMFHEHAARNWIDSFSVDFLNVLNVGTERNFISWRNTTFVWN